MKGLIKENKKLFFILLSITLAAFLLRITGLDKQSGFWYDEVITYNSAIQEFPTGVIKSTIHGPLYFLLLSLWMKIFGDADTTLRLFSVLSGVLTIPAMYLAGNELGKTRVGMLAAGFAAINSLLIYYSQELRFYSLVILLSTLCAYSLIRLLRKNNTSSCILFSVVNILLISSYVLGIVFVFIEVILILLYFWINDRKSFKKFFIYISILAGLSLIVFFTVLFNFIKVKFAIDGYFLKVFDIFYFNFDVFFILLQNWFSPFLAGIHNNPQQYLHRFISEGINSQKLIFVILPVFLGLSGIFLGILNKIKRLNIPKLLFIISIFFMLFEILLTLTGQLVIMTRYTLVILPFLILVMSYGFATIKSKYIYRLIIFLFIGINLFFVFFSPISAARLQRPDGQKYLALLLGGIDSEVQFNDEDIFILPRLEYYADKHYKIEGKRISLQNTFMWHENLDLLIGRELEGKITDKNAHELLKNYFVSEKPPGGFEKFVEKNYTDSLKDKRYFVIIKNKNLSIFKPIHFKILSRREDLYKKQSLNFMLYSKITEDLVRVAKKQLKLMEIKENKSWQVYVFKKEDWQ